MDNLKTTGLYVCGYSATHKPKDDVPFYVVVQKYMIGNQAVVRQIAGRAGIDVVYERWFSDNAWGFWRTIQYDTPSFYKNYQTIAALATALGATGIDSSSTSAFVYKNDGVVLGSGTEEELKEYIVTKLKSPSNEVGLSLYVAAKNGGVRYAFATVHSGINYFAGIIFSFALSKPIYFVYNNTTFTTWNRISVE